MKDPRNRVLIYYDWLAFILGLDEKKASIMIKAIANYVLYKEKSEEIEKEKSLYPMWLNIIDRLDLDFGAYSRAIYKNNKKREQAKSMKESAKDLSIEEINENLDDLTEDEILEIGKQRMKRG